MHLNRKLPDKPETFRLQCWMCGRNRKIYTTAGDDPAPVLLKCETCDAAG